MAMAHHQAGRTLDAEGVYRQILEIDPDNPDALHFLGLIHHSAGRLEHAVSLIERAIAAKPTAPMHYNLGIVLQALGNYEAAATSYRDALSLDPSDANALNNLGSALQAQGLLVEAEDSFRKSLAINPNAASAHCNLGVVLQRQGKSDEAIACFRQAIAVDGNYAEAYNNLGNAMQERNAVDAAVVFLRKAVALNPNYADAHSNLGFALREQGNLDEAIVSFLRALDLNPDSVVVPWNLSFALLLKGQLHEGWAMYDWRLRQPGVLARHRGLPSLRPSYSGQDLTGKTVLVWAEQGLGDEVIFASALPDAIRAAGHCVVECDRRLVPLYARSFPEAEVIPKEAPPHARALASDIDWQCPAGSLLRWLRPTIDSFPQHRGYLVPDGERVAFWKKRLDALGPGPKVGISWRSKNRSVSRNVHYTELDQWGPVLSVSGLTFVNLQYDDCRNELDSARQRFGTVVHDWDDLNQMSELDDVAALMKALDLVIGPATSPTVMAAAVGAPVWMLLTKDSTWETLGTERMPMFPEMRIVWRARNVAWDAVLSQVADELKGGRRPG